jgi:hypothetical protein
MNGQTAKLYALILLYARHINRNLYKCKKERNIKAGVAPCDTYAI